MIFFGSIRLRTKLAKKEDANFCFTYPIVLPAQHPTIRLLIFDQKRKQFHAGVQILLNRLKKDYLTLAVIEELMPDQFGNLRLARVKTSHGTLLRPVQKLQILEI